MSIKVIKEDKFKEITINVRFLVLLKEEDIIAKMILANMLNDSCMKYVDKSSISNYLDELYGASYSASTSILGRNQSMMFKTRTIQPKFIHNQVNLVEEQFKLLNEFILHPLMKDASFQVREFKEAKKNLLDQIKRMLDDPGAFSMYEAMRIAAEGQPMAMGAIRDLKEIEKVTLEDVNKQYFNMIENSQIDILVLGNIEEKEVNEYIRKYLNFKNMDIQMKDVPCYKLEVKDIERKQYGYKDISQCYITSIYATHTRNDEVAFSALRVANAMLGQIPSSLLFQEVREKNSLCYSIYSAINQYDGALGISTGIESKDIEKALDLIDIQFKRMCTGDFEDSLIETSKKMLVNSLTSTNDDADSILSLSYRNILFKKEETVQDVIKKIENVEKTDIIEVMNKCEHILSYVLKERED